MTKKIFRSITAVAAAVLLACFVLILGILYSHFSSNQKENLRSALSLAATAVEENGLEYLETVKDEDYRFTWVAADGTVLFDSEGDAANMENHKNREEVAEAFETGVGESSRYSQTLTEETVYYAKLLKDGTVLRVAVGRLTVLTIVLGMIQPLIVVIAITLILSLLLARRLSKKIVEPLNSIDLEKPLDNNAYDELSPMLTKIEKQRRLIDGQIRQLDANRAEFYTVIKSMKEGLVLLNDKGTVLSINPAAESVFGTDETCVGKDFLTVDRSLEVGKLLADAKTDGHAQMQSERKGKVYQLNASRIGTAANPAGIVLLVFDVTEKVFAERNRREFTSNVSHELMTPLHSIMGCSELMENGLVKEEDVPRFIERIHSESSKLMTLVEDIIELSELDENADLPRKDVDLLAIAKEETAVLAEEAAKKNIKLAVEGEPTSVNGVQRLLREIVHNLCDNAVRYTERDGSVTVSVGTEEGEAVVSVSDTGIGIPPEDLERVFERFYRTDKSRSKETGGAGLGLSIVKHAVSYMGGRIKLDSAPGVGTTFKVYLKKSEK